MAVTLDESREGESEPGGARTDATAEEHRALWYPHRGDGVEGLAEEGCGVSAARGEAGLVGGVLLVEADELSLLAFAAVAVGTMFVVETADDGGEVAAAVADVVAVHLRAKGHLGAVEDLERVETEVVDEGLARAGQGVDVVDVGEQEPGAAVRGAGLVAVASGEVGELVGGESGSSLESVAGRPGAELVGAQHGGDDEASCGLGQGGIAQSRDHGGEAIGQGEERSGHGLDGLESALDGGLGPWVSLALRGVLGLELFECASGLGSHVGRALVGEDLCAPQVGECVGQEADDCLCALVVIDDDGVEQVLVAAADVLCGEELQGDTEDGQVGGVGGELSVGQHDVEREARAARGP